MQEQEKKLSIFGFIMAVIAIILSVFGLELMELIISIDWIKFPAVSVFKYTK